MARYRNVSTDFWLDPFVLDLTPEEKYFYMYLMINKHATFCGIYPIHRKIMELETGYNRETIEKLIERFVGYKKIKYNEDNNELMMLNWVKYNQPNNLNVVKGIIAELKDIKTEKFVNEYIKMALVIVDKDAHRDMLLNAQNELNKATGKGLARGLEVIEIESEIEIEMEIESEIEIEMEIESEIENKDLVDTGVSPASSENKKVTPVKKPKVPYTDIVNLFNSTCNKYLPQVQVISDKRKNGIRIIWEFAKGDIKILENIFTKAIESDFLSGRNGAWTGCNFDWLINQNNSIKVLEGNYENKGAANKSRTLTEQLQSDAVKDFLGEEGEYE